MRNPHVNPRNPLLAASDAPTDHTDQFPRSMALADQRPSSITLAGVLPFLSASAHESRMQLEVVPQPRLPQLLLTLRLSDDRDVHLFQHVLVLAEVPECVLAPSGGPAARSGEVLPDAGQASGADVRGLGPIDGFVEAEDRDVVVEGAGVEFGVDVHGDDVAFHVGVELHVVVDVPFAQADAEVVSVVTVEKQRW